MKILWPGHSGFRIGTAGAVLLPDPWLAGDPICPEGRRDAALAGGQAIPALGNADLISHATRCHPITGTGCTKGGTVTKNGARVTMVNASQSPPFDGPDGPVYAGAGTGFRIGGKGHVIYSSGDTDIMAQMAWMAERHAPDIGLPAAGGHCTMDRARAAFAARKYFSFRTVILRHYRTFPLLEHTADAMRRGLLPEIRVAEPQLLVPILFRRAWPQSRRAAKKSFSRVSAASAPMPS